MNENIVKFSKKYTFEGKDYTELDLSALEQITESDAEEIQKHYEREGGGPLLPEMSMKYARIAAARVTKLPHEFFKGLPVKDAMKVKATVSNIFFGEE